MKIIKTPLAEAVVVETEPFRDHRGMFARFFCQDELAELMGNRKIVNVNFSRTLRAGSVRGLHYQHPPKAEMKLVRCLSGAVYDVIVDIRAGSQTFLQTFEIELSAENMKLLCVPEGFAHGYQSLMDNVDLLYLTTEFFSPESEGILNHSDPALGIGWPLDVSDLSDKDRNQPYIHDSFSGVRL